MVLTTKFDSVGDPGVKLFFDDVAVFMNVSTTDDGGTVTASKIFTDLTAQSAVDLVRGDRAGQIILDKDNGLIWAIAPDNSSVFTVQKDDATPQQVALTAAQTNVITGWLVSSLPNVHRGT